RSPGRPLPGNAVSEAPRVCAAAGIRGRGGVESLVRLHGPETQLHLRPPHTPADCTLRQHQLRIMASKKKEIILQVTVNNQELWEEMLGFKGLIVVDVYQGWCGPCRTVVNLSEK
ncbi:NME/NM23 family member 9, partial [Chelydra serpentina]